MISFFIELFCKPQARIRVLGGGGGSQSRPAPTASRHTSNMTTSKCSYQRVESAANLKTARVIPKVFFCA